VPRRAPRTSTGASAARIVLPDVATAGTFPASSEDTAAILQSLAVGISRTSEEAENQNKIQPEQLDYLKAKDAKKKNKAEKWHPTSRRLVINAASTDGDSPADKIPKTYLRIINSETAGMADKELQAQMSELRYADAGFAHGLVASLYVGDILWSNRTTPSNLSPFTVFKLDPLSTQQATRCLQLHLLSKNTEGKSLEEIKTSQNQEVKVPTTFEELHQILLFYSGITSILFGLRSVLVAGAKSFAMAILSEKIIFKGRIAADRELLAKILYALKIRIQRWLGECLKFEDRSMVNDRLVCFDEVFEMVMNSTINVILPPNFVKPAPKASPTSTDVMSPDGDGKKKKGRKRKSGDVEGERITKNPAPISKFLLKDGRYWKEHFAGKCSKDRPKWDNTIFMCARWHIHGECFVDCHNKASHVGASAVPQAKKDEFLAYITKVCRENTPSSSA
jgi:hypothetical protein